jgi:hypothetical protein
MTTYTITLGYNSGNTFNSCDEERWAILKEEVAKIRSLPDDIRIAVFHLDPMKRWTADEVDEIKELITAYHHDNTDLTVYYADEDAPDPRERKLRQSTSYPGRLKHHVRRAFCRLVIQAMHRRGIEVNLNVS